MKRNLFRSCTLIGAVGVLGVLASCGENPTTSPRLPSPLAPAGGPNEAKFDGLNGESGNCLAKDADGNATSEGSKVALVYGQMNEPPGARARVALSGLTIAEYFRDQEGQDVLFFVDNIFRFTQAGSEVSALLGRIPSAVGRGKGKYLLA